MDSLNYIKKVDKHRNKLGRRGLIRWLYLLARNKKTHYVITTFGIGDAIAACKYLKAYRKTYNISHITLIGKKNKGDIIKLFSQEYDDLILLDDKEIVELSDAFLLDYPYTRFFKWSFRVTPAVLICHIRDFDFSVRKGSILRETTMEGLYRSLVFNLKDDVREEKPVFPKCDLEIFKKTGAIQGSSVLFAPDANSVSKLDDRFWISLVDYYTKKGVLCFTNVVKKTDKPLPGTIGVSFSAVETAQFAEYCGHVVSLRSGLCDLMKYVKCKMAVIYGGDDAEMTKHFYSLQDGEKKAIINEYLIDDDNFVEQEKLIIDFMEI